MNKKVLHITFQLHPFLEDLELFWWFGEFINDVWDIDYLNTFEIIILHFVKWKDLTFLDKINKNIKIWLFLHDYSAICPKSTLLHNDNKKCLIEDYNNCDCIYIKQNKDEFCNFLVSSNILFDKLNFIVSFDNSSYDKLLPYSKIHGFKLIMIKHWININNILVNKTKSDKFRVWFCWNFKEHKWEIVLLNLFKNKLDDFFLKQKIEFNFYILWKEKIDKKDNINFYYNKNREEIYSNIDCLIIPSIWNETWPMVLYEAFANKIPVIISDQESLKEKVIYKVDSYTFKTWDEKELFKWILWMKKNYQKVISNKVWFRYNTIENFNIELNNLLNEL